MIHTVKSSGLLKYDLVWFPDVPNLPQVWSMRCPAVVIRQASAEFLVQYTLRVVHSRRFCTAVVDLTQPADILLERLHKTRRSRLRKAAALGYETHVGRPGELTGARDLIDGFNWASFGHPVSAANWQLVEQHGWIAQTSLDGQILAAIAMVADGQRRARVLYGATAERSDDPARSRTISDLNSALVWDDMLRCQARGIHTYDLGGLFDDPSHPSSGIDEFKLSFGAQRLYEYHALTSPYWLARRGMGAVIRDF